MTGMKPFHFLFPGIGFDETRTVTLSGKGDGLLPCDSYAFVEAYCIEPRCDCRRVLLSVLAKNRQEHMATINYAFDPPTSNLAVREQIFLDPLNPQSRWSDALFDLFLELLRDEKYRARLERHYHLVKDALADSEHEIHRIIAPFRIPQPVKQRKAGNTIGRNDPCPCGSEKKYKKCCGGKS